jgi:two-component system sensor histidine kinase HydH
LEEQMRRNEKLTAMRKLASAVAHEIRNPLNSINLIVDLIKKKYKPVEDIEQYNVNLMTVQKEISRISTIVDEFIHLARLPERKLAPIDFPKLLSEIDALFHARLENQINIVYDMHNNPEYHGDPEQLKQVFINLIQNAIEAISPPGKITVTGRTRAEMYEISIKDTGCGISNNDLEQIFDIYFTTKKQGNGIGLAVVHQIISSHNGTIDVESTEGRGTTFLLRFPLDGET